jgi:hypothetical protein
MIYTVGRSFAKEIMRRFETSFKKEDKELSSYNTLIIDAIKTGQVKSLGPVFDALTN